MAAQNDLRVPARLGFAMSLSAMIFGQDSAIHKATNILGMGIPGLLHKAFMPNSTDPKMAPQRLGELSNQSAKEGGARPIVYGIGRPIGGNIMYMSRPVIRMVKTYVGMGGGGGGKGGKKKKPRPQYQDVEHVYRYYAIRVCEGPITGFRRIWRNGQLVYDARKGSKWGAKNNHLFFQNYRLYTGSWGQMPDSMLQSRWGMDIPAHRGTAYLVADNEDLTSFGGAIPQWQFEVVRSEGYYLTSRPYPLEFGDQIAPNTKPTFARRKIAVADVPPDTARITVFPASVSVHTVLKEEELQPEYLAISVKPTAVNIRSSMQEINTPADGLNISPTTPRVVSRVNPFYGVAPETLAIQVDEPRVSIEGLSSPVVALMHFDGNFRNEAPFEVVRNNAVLSATESRFGSGSLAGGRASNRAISILTQQFGTQDFTVEFWYKRTSAETASSTLVDNRTATGANKGFLLTCPRANPNGLAFYSGGTTGGWDASITPDYTLPLAQWVHVAAVRYGDRALLFAGGAMVGESSMPANTNIDANNRVFFGGNLNGTASVSMPGFADELRISKGVALYTENFTPPVEPFTYP